MELQKELDLKNYLKETVDLFPPIMKLVTLDELMNIFTSFRKLAIINCLLSKKFVLESELELLFGSEVKEDLDYLMKTNMISRFTLHGIHCYTLTKFGIEIIYRLFKILPKWKLKEVKHWVYGV